MPSDRDAECMRQLEQRLFEVEEQLRFLKAAVAGLLFERSLTIDQVIALEYSDLH